MSGPIPAPVRNRPDVWRFGFSGALSVKAGASKAHNDTGASLNMSLVRVSVGTAPTGSPLVVDVLKDGVSILNAPISLPAGSVTMTAVPAVVALETGAGLTVSVTAIGAAVAGADLIVSVVVN